MRLLFDARSVRTPSAVQVLVGLTRGWLEDSRVEEVVAVVPDGFDTSCIPAGVRVSRCERVSWFRYLGVDLPRIADRHRADFIFSPNALAPRDPRAVLYFQDLHHFRWPADVARHPSYLGRGMLRKVWNAYSVRSGRAAIAVSHDMASEVEKHVPLPLRVIPNGVDIGSHRWSGERDVVFVAGGIGPRKGESVALRAWGRLRGSAGATTLLIGGVEPESRRAELEQLALRLGVSESVRVLGLLARDLYLDHIANSRVALSCSSFESFGMPVAEALAMGAPLICSAVPAHVELLTAAGSGESFPIGDDASLALRLKAALDGQLPPRHPLTEAWSWSARARQHVDFYRTLRH